jgi:hypothetical protein
MHTRSHKTVAPRATNKQASPNVDVTKKSFSSEDNAGGSNIKVTHEQEVFEGTATETEQGSSDSALVSSKGTLGAKKHLPADSKDLALPTELSSTSEVAKRSSEIKVYTSDSDANNNHLDIEVKSYTPPQNTSAVIEVRPHRSNGYETDFGTYPNENSWPGYQFYPNPQEINGPFNWYMDRYQPPVLPSLSYVPTEELLHSQSYTNNPGLSSQLLYQYPVKQEIYTDRSQQNHVQNIPPKRLDNTIISPKSDSKHDYSSFFKYPMSPPAQISADNLDTSQQYQYFVPQSDIQQYFLPNSNEIPKSPSIEAGTEFNYKPSLLKYVTNSFYLKTYPKLEWVPL